MTQYSIETYPYGVLYDSLMGSINLDQSIILNIMAYNQTHDHPIRGRFHKWFLTKTEGILEGIHGERKKRLFSDLHGIVVEIGPGTGANCMHFPKQLKYIGIEPNLRLHQALQKKVKEFELDYEVRSLVGEALNVADNSVDFVVSTLVLCSVHDPKKVIQEAFRVLKPGGKFIYIEHVAAKQGSLLRGFQNMIQPFWTWLFEGCRPNRETEKMLWNSGFEDLEVERFTVNSVFFHVSPHIAGSAVKPQSLSD